MCLIALAYRVHPAYPLILIANRDEFYERPTREAQFWAIEGYPEILAGKDLSAGGTWMGISKNKKWAALTNYRDLSQLKKNPPSRGNLVLDYLKEDISPLDYLHKIDKIASQYNGFNLLVADNDDLFYYTGVTQETIALPPGIHGVSNAFLNTPWPKLNTTKSALRLAIERNETDESSLFAILANTNEADDQFLPKTGLSYELEKAVSATFIKTSKYGTRCSTLLYIHSDGKVKFTERRFISQTDIPKDELTFSF